MQFLTGHYWALFDGHGGPAAAILAANTLHSCLRRQLEAVVEGMMATQPPMHLSGRCVCSSDPQFVEEKGIRAEDLVIGALENAFQECVSGPFGEKGRSPEGLKRTRGITAHHSHHSLGCGEVVLIPSFLVIAPWSSANPSHVSSSLCVLTAHLSMPLVLSAGSGFFSCFELHFPCVSLFMRYSGVNDQAFEMRCCRPACGNVIVRSRATGGGGKFRRSYNNLGLL